MGGEPLRALLPPPQDKNCLWNRRQLSARTHSYTPRTLPPPLPHTHSSPIPFPHPSRLPRPTDPTAGTRRPQAQPGVHSHLGVRPDRAQGAAARLRQRVRGLRRLQVGVVRAGGWPWWRLGGWGAAVACARGGRSLRQLLICQSYVPLFAAHVSCCVGKHTHTHTHTLANTTPPHRTPPPHCTGTSTATRTAPRCALTSRWATRWRACTRPLAPSWPCCTSSAAGSSSRGSKGMAVRAWARWWMQPSARACTT